MLNKKDILKNLEFYKEKLALKGYNFNVEEFLEIEKNRKDIQIKLEDNQARKNQIAKTIPIYKKENKDINNLVKEGENINKEIKVLNENFNTLKNKLENILIEMPNIPHENCPIGDNEEQNIVVKNYKEPLFLDFKAKDHTDLAKNKLNFGKAVNLAKNRFVVMENEVAKLHRVLANFMIEEQIKKGYIECNTPVLVNRNTLVGTGQLPKFSEELYKIENEDLYLIPTAEVTLTNLLANEILNKNELPVKLTAHTNCFRSEAGAYGKDTKGIIRQHQFEKIELVQVLEAEKAEKELNNLLLDAENILKLLDIPYRVVELCTGDLGFGAKKTYDIEVWIPSQNTYREISSCTWFGDFQARRINIKCKDNKNEYLHTINGSGLAVGRTLVAVMENYQTADGNIKIPKVLRKYFDNEFLF